MFLQPPYYCPGHFLSIFFESSFSCQTESWRQPVPKPWTSSQSSYFPTYPLLQSSGDTGNWVFFIPNSPLISWFTCASAYLDVHLDVELHQSQTLDLLDTKLASFTIISRVPEPLTSLGLDQSLLSSPPAPLKSVFHKLAQRLPFKIQPNSFVTLLL